MTHSRTPALPAGAHLTKRPVIRGSEQRKRKVEFRSRPVEISAEKREITLEVANFPLGSVVRGKMMRCVVGFVLIGSICVESIAISEAQSLGSDTSIATNGVVVTYDRLPPTFGAAPKEIWFKRGDAVRIDTHWSDGQATIGQQFTRHGQKVIFNVQRLADGRLQSLYLMDDPLRALPEIPLRAFSGATEEYLGRNCRVWQLAHQFGNRQFVQSGCITSDGIELWWKNSDISTLRATSIAYKSVPEQDVKAPFEAFDLEKWAIFDENYDHSGDYRVDFSGNFYYRQTTRVSVKSGPWLSVSDQDKSGVSNVSLINMTTGFKAKYSKFLDGTRHFSVVRDAKPHLQSQPRAHEVRLDNHPDGMLLGEQCQWWDTAPGVHDAGRSECRTIDAIPLIIRTSSRGTQFHLTATHLSRSSQPISAVILRKEILDPAFWGFH